jgi:hypothetical protein
MRTLRILALLVGVLLVVQGILGLAAPDVFVGDYPFHSNASRDIPGGGPARRDWSCARSRGAGLARTQVSARFRIHHRHWGSAHAVRWFLGRPIHSWLVVDRGTCSGARICGSFPGARPPHLICGCSRTSRLMA